MNNTGCPFTCLTDQTLIISSSSSSSINFFLPSLVWKPILASNDLTVFFSILSVRIKSFFRSNTILNY